MAATEEQAKKSAETLTTMLELLGLDAEVDGVDGDGEITLELRTEDPGRIIGRKGQYIESLEFLLNRLLRQKGTFFPRVSVSVDGYQRKPRPRHGRREPVDAERLRQLAMDTAKEVKRWGENKTLPAMRARERRLIHMTLREDPEVETVSGPDEGGGMKKIVVRTSGSG